MGFGYRRGLMVFLFLLAGASEVSGHADDGWPGVSAVHAEAASRGPRVAIEVPVVELDPTGGAMVHLIASVMDSEEGDHGAALEWRSDRMGLLGRGTSLDVWLPLGLHEVSAIIVDAAGRRGQDTRRVHVRVPLLLTVNAGEDNVDGTCDAAHCSLREAILEANANLGLDTVVIPAGAYRLSRPGVGELASRTGDLNILDDLILAGAGATETLIEAAGVDRVMSVGPVAVTVRDLTLRGGTTVGTAQTSVGALGHGGGMYAGAGSRVVLERCEVVGNQARSEEMFGAMGGGLFVDDGADVRIVESSITGNQTEAPRGTVSLGGGLYVANGGVATVTNSTVAGNATRLDGMNDGGAGSGAHVSRGGVLMMVHATVANNPPAPVGATATGAVLGEVGADLRWAGSIVSGRCSLGSPAVSLGGSVESPGDTCGLSSPRDQRGVSIAAMDLGPLTDNGGTTPTMLPGPESAAIDRADDPDCPPRDQRGAARPRDGDLDGIAACDAGAVERPEPRPPTTLVLTSIGEQDGWIRESAEGSGVGGGFSSSDGGRQAIQMGDDRRNRALRGVLSFDTELIPMGAIVESVTVRVRRGQVGGGNPFDSLGACQVAAPGGVLGASSALASEDFAAIGLAPTVGLLSSPSADGDWSEARLTVEGLAAIDRTGVTQFGLLFETDSNRDGGVDWMGFFGGDLGDDATHPQLVVTYRE